MNITSIVSLSRYGWQHTTTIVSSLFHYILQLVLQIGKPSYLISHYGLSCIRFLFVDFAHFSLSIGSLAVIVVVLSFIKSLRPRYNLSADLSHRGEEDGKIKIALNKRKPLIKTLKDGSKNKLTLIQRLQLKLRSLADVTNQQVGLALSSSDIRAVHKQLSWSQTHIDLESVKWLNQTLLSLWPCVKGALRTFVFDGLLRPKTYGLSGYHRGLKHVRSETHNKVPIEADKFSKSPTKLSIYISSRRKLELMQREKHKVIRRQNGSIQRGIFHCLIYAYKLIVIYLRQFLMDYIALWITVPQQHAKDVLNKQIELDLDRLLVHPDNSLDRKSDGGGAKSWAGFEFCDRERNASKKQVRGKSKSAPGHIAPKHQVRVIMRTSGLVGTDKLRKLHSRLPSLMQKAREKIFRREVTLEKIQLGDSIPLINGVKYLGETNGILHDKMEPLLAASDEANMRFIVELSYRSDSKFSLIVGNLPVLDRIRVRSISFQFRFMITVNHTIAELNKNLELFNTPDDILFPALNHVQLTVIDVPSFDWCLDRPKGIDHKQKSNSTNKTNKISLMKALNFVDPLNLINNTYFKYIIHSVFYLTLKWFQPFDIKVGPHLFIKTAC